MSNIPVLKPQEVVRILENLGFVEVRQRGSHKQFRHEDGRGSDVNAIALYGQRSNVASAL